MPTGYTAGIIDGTITSFPQFAKQCARNFGALIHMRDEPFEKEWEPRVPHDYHSKKIAESNVVIEEMRRMSDEELVASELKRIDEKILYHTEAIEKTKQVREKLNTFLREAKKYAPPTENHTGLAAFMQEQIRSTLEYDGSTTYHDNALAELNARKESINANRVRSARIEQAKKDLLYHEREHAAEVRRCEESNQWYAELLKSLGE